MNHAQLLRWSLLGSLSVVPIACGGTRGGGPSDDNAGTESGGSSGSSTSISGMGGSVGGGGTGALREPPSCTSPQLEVFSGLTTCSEGYVYRSQLATCSARQASPPGGAGTGGGAGAAPASAWMICQTGADCVGLPGGFCDIAPSVGSVASVCRVGCLTDEECADGELCACEVSGGACARANCRSDDDCEVGYHCARHESACRADPGFSCQRADDACLTKADCTPGHVCVGGFSEDASRVCLSTSGCGRPFLVASQARVAPVIASRDWLV